MIAIVSHDLKNLLQAIFLGAQDIREQSAAAGSWQEIRDSSEIILNATKRMQGMISDLLDLSRIEAGHLQVQRSPLDAADLELQLRNIFEKIAAAKNIRFRIQGFANAHQPLFVDKERLIQAVSNLLSNAIKFTPPQGSVTLEYRENPDEDILCVQDTGPGISAEDLPHIFDRYWQPRKTAKQGSGLGLYIARGIAEAHGGQLRVESRSGQGCIFSIHLPRRSQNSFLPAVQQNEMPVS